LRPVRASGTLSLMRCRDDASIATALFALSWLSMAACGPGLEAVHESNLRFEHCYRLDMDPRIAPPHREHCWRDWTVAYGYDQPLDHIEYARRRIVALESGDTRLIAVRSDAPMEGRVFEEVASPDAPMAAPAPTSANAPPPRTEPVVAPAAVSLPAASARPGDGCVLQCEAPLLECSRLCDAKQADCATCREDYRRCMRRCFE
jgi:hypothetical protein